MSLRLVEIIVPTSLTKRVEELIQEEEVEEQPRIPLGEDLMMVRIILDAEETEAVTMRFNEVFSTFKGFRINILQLGATIPEYKPKEEKEKEEKEKAEAMNKSKKSVTSNANNIEVTDASTTTGEEGKAVPEKKQRTANDKQKKKRRISRDELYSDLSDSVKVNVNYVVLVVLSVIVAAVGLVENNIAVIIGAMVIAPLLTPNVALSLSTTLANQKLARKALITLVSGLLLALALSFVFGLFLHVDPAINEIALRTKVGMGDIIIGFAAGAAAALFFAIGAGTALVGVTVAAALLPPLVVTGLLLGEGEFYYASQSLLLLISNLIGINLAGTIVFISLGVWPSEWRDEAKAKRSALTAVGIWIILFFILMLILLAGEHILKLV